MRHHEKSLLGNSERFKQDVIKFLNDNHVYNKNDENFNSALFNALVDYLQSYRGQNTHYLTLWPYARKYDVTDDKVISRFNELDAEAKKYLEKVGKKIGKKDKENLPNFDFYQFLLTYDLFKPNDVDKGIYPIFHEKFTHLKTVLTLKPKARDVESKIKRTTNFKKKLVVKTNTTGRTSSTNIEMPEKQDQKNQLEKEKLIIPKSKKPKKISNDDTIHSIDTPNNNTATIVKMPSSFNLDEALATQEQIKEILNGVYYEIANFFKTSSDLNLAILVSLIESQLNFIPQLSKNTNNHFELYPVNTNKQKITGRLYKNSQVSGLRIETEVFGTRINFTIDAEVLANNKIKITRDAEIVANNSYASEYGLIKDSLTNNGIFSLNRTQYSQKSRVNYNKENPTKLEKSELTPLLIN